MHVCVGIIKDLTDELDVVVPFLLRGGLSHRPDEADEGIDYRLGWVGRLCFP